MELQRVTVGPDDVFLESPARSSYENLRVNTFLLGIFRNVFIVRNRASWTLINSWRPHVVLDKTADSLDVRILVSILRELGPNFGTWIFSVSIFRLLESFKFLNGR